MLLLFVGRSRKKRERSREGGGLLIYVIGTRN
jgi:hypothetical protein